MSVVITIVPEVIFGRAMVTSTLAGRPARSFGCRPPKSMHHHHNNNTITTYDFAQHHDHDHDAESNPTHGSRRHGCRFKQQGHQCRHSLWLCSIDSFDQQSSTSPTWHSWCQRQHLVEGVGGVA